MKYLHSPGDEDQFVESGQYTVTDGERTITETWEQYRRPDGFTVWCFEQTGVPFERLGHLLINADDAPERLHVHQRGDAGAHRQTYTFFDDGVMIADNRVAGRWSVELPEQRALLTPFAAAARFAFTFPPTQNERITHQLYLIRQSPEGILAGRLSQVQFAPLGTDEFEISEQTYTGYGWRLFLQQGTEEFIWLTDAGVPLTWVHSGWEASLTKRRTWRK